jgi:hypothetical protein
MEKVARLINILDDSVVDKLVLLDRLVRLHARFLTKWRIAEVTSNGILVRVKFAYIDKYKYETHTEREFPMEDIDKRISSYKRKIKKEFAERHENPRLLRERDIYRWELLIKNLRTNADI